jgi:uracil-DNA glycosylase family 4
LRAVLWQPIRDCTACPAHERCKGPTPPSGPTNARIMLIGEAPGQREDETAVPFTGPAGQFLDGLLASIGISREDVWVTNLVKCRPPNNTDPTAGVINVCAPRWLELELSSIAPDIVVTLGVPASRYVLGAGWDDTMDHMHGYPIDNVQLPGGHTATVLPVYHPAAGLHNASQIRAIFNDFAAVGRLLRGEAAERLADEYPDPLYREVPSWSPPDQSVAVDVETLGLKGPLWSVQFSSAPGTAEFLLTSAGIAIPDAIVHNYLYDARYLTIGRFRDTMVMAWLLGMPQSLKTLARDLCGMEMQDLGGILRPYTRNLAFEYLDKASQIAWPSPPKIEVTEWVNKLGRVATRTVRPHPINRKIGTILKSVDGDNPYQKWRDIRAEERATVEAVLGPMHEATLADIPRHQAVEYACRDADATLRVDRVLGELIDKERMGFVFNAMEMPLQQIVLQMVDNGIKADPDKLRALSDKLSSEMAVIAETAAVVAGTYVHCDNGATLTQPYAFNPNSDTQVAELVYKHLGYPPTKLTDKRNRPSVDDNELRKVRVKRDGVTPDYASTGSQRSLVFDPEGSLHPVIPHILAYRERATIKGRDAGGLLRRLDSGGALHGDIRTTATETGRLTSNDPNVLALGKEVRGVLQARQGYQLVEMDYSQIEMRLVMDHAGCEDGIQLFLDGRDIHTETAMRIFGVAADVAREPKYRTPTKGLGFGIVYGITEHGIHQQLIDQGVTDWSMADCKGFLEEWHVLYPEVRLYQQKLKEFARRHKYIEDMFGRRRYVPELMVPINRVRSAGERKVINMPMQSGAQGIIKLSMAAIDEQFRMDFVPTDTGFGVAVPTSRWLLQVHDSNLWEIWSPVVEQRAEDYRVVMESVVRLSVPLVVDVKSGSDWGHMEEM